MNHTHVTREIRQPGHGCPACDDYHIDKSTSFLGLPAVVKKVEGSVVTYELGSERVVVTVDMAPREKTNRSRSSG